MTLNKCHVSFECFSRAWKEKPINFVVYFVWLEIIEKVSLSRWHCWQAQILITSHQHTYQFTQNLTKRYKYWRIDWKEKEQKRREKKGAQEDFRKLFQSPPSTWANNRQIEFNIDNYIVHTNTHTTAAASTIRVK